MRISTVLCLWILLIPGITQGAPMQENLPYKEGKHYTKLDASYLNKPAIEKYLATHKEPVKVMEFFTYACKYCYRFNPMINQWVSKHNPPIYFDQITATTRRQWRLLTKAHYTAKALKMDDNFNKKLFRGVHRGKINELSPKAIKEFFIQEGADETLYDKMLNSKTVEADEQLAMQLFSAYGIRVEPTVVLFTPKGNYITSPALAGGLQEILDMLDFLVTKDSEKL